MVFYEPIAVGLAQLRSNKLRSLLTLLGIVIGVASVIGIVSLGEGLRQTVMGDFAQRQADAVLDNAFERATFQIAHDDVRRVMVGVVVIDRQQMGMFQA